MRAHRVVVTLILLASCQRSPRNAKSADPNDPIDRGGIDAGIALDISEARLRRRTATDELCRAGYEVACSCTGTLVYSADVDGCVIDWGDPPPPVPIGEGGGGNTGGSGTNQPPPRDPCEFCVVAYRNQPAQFCMNRSTREECLACYKEQEGRSLSDCRVCMEGREARGCDVNAWSSRCKGDAQATCGPLITSACKDCVKGFEQGIEACRGYLEESGPRSTRIRKCQECYRNAVRQYTDGCVDRNECRDAGGRPPFVPPPLEGICREEPREPREPRNDPEPAPPSP